MKQSFSSDKMNLAWFKLEEFVARGEKERALTIYRLLTHSINDEAVKKQLEGDILRIFNDPGAVSAYLKAAELYEQENKLIQAAELYELITVLVPDSYEHSKARLNLYLQLSHSSKLYSAAKHLLGILIKQDRLIQAHDLVQEISFVASQKADLHAELVFAMMNSSKTIDIAFLQVHLKAAIEGYLEVDGHASLQLNQFLTRLAAKDALVHEQAEELVRSW